MSEEYTPVLVGVGQVTERDFDENGSSPLDLMEQATRLAVADAGISEAALADLDTLVIVKSFRESTRNSPEALANRLGAGRARQWLMPDGGNGPQYLVNRFAEGIAKGEQEFCLFTGAEAMATGRKIVKSTGEQPPWQEPASGDPEFLVEGMEMASDHERNHGIFAATGFYAMSESAMRHKAGRGLEEHQLEMGKLFARFTEVAAQSPHAWYPIARSAEDIAFASDQNRMVAWPYTKFMNAMNQINQSAALLLTSVDYARRLGINEDRFIYLHGCADAKEHRIAVRPNYHSSTAMARMAEEVFRGSSLGIDDIAHIDFYSCFPSAVQMAREVFGMARDDARDLTITGGLPFHGGAGNNYVMNSIAAMVEKVREDSGSYGLVTANGGYFDKHAAGIYSTVPTSGAWQRRDPAEYQAEINAIELTPFTEDPIGEASIETYTVYYGRDQSPQGSTVIGRLGDYDDPSAARFFSMLPNDRDLLEQVTATDMIGTRGSVSQDGDINVFTPA